ncbi:MAG TPA: DUF1572 family protein [Vicinamibacteria bacterium]|jgi:hypothetical protein
MSERDEVGKEFLRSARSRLGSLKALGDEALTRLDDAELTKTLDPESNSVAVLVQHIAGNMRSRWTDFLTTDGEKADRNRDGEFEPGLTAKAPLVQRWEEGWRILFAALDTLKPEDLTRTVVIRGERLSALDAINRQLVHYGQHVGQVVYLAKHFKWQTWKSLSVPRRRPPAKG